MGADLCLLELSWDPELPLESEPSILRVTSNVIPLTDSVYCLQ